MKINRKICIMLAVIMLIGVATALGACGNNNTGSNSAADNSLKEIQDKGELIIGVDNAFPPMAFVDTDGSLVGFDIDLAQAVADKMGVKLTVTPIDWNAKEALLQTKKIDAIWNGYSITKDRIDKVQFTKPYLSNEQMLVVKSASTIQTKADLAGKILGVQSDSAAEDMVNADTAFKDSLKELRAYKDYQLALTDLKASDRIQAVAVDKILIDYIMTQSPGTFRTLNETLGSEYFGIGVRKGGVALADAIDKALDDMKASGETATICQKWFGSDVVIRDIPRQTAADFS